MTEKVEIQITLSWNCHLVFSSIALSSRFANEPLKRLLS